MTGHNNSASFDHKHRGISTLLQVSHRKRKASPSLVLEKLFLQVESTLMLVYFNPSFQGIFLFGTSFMEYSYMFYMLCYQPNWGRSP